MLGITIGLPLGIFVFLLVGALIGTASGNASNGIVPGLLAGAAAFAFCMRLQAKEHERMENQLITTSCSPELAFGTILNALDSTHLGADYWASESLPHILTLHSRMRFDEIISGEFGKPVGVHRLIRLNTTIKRGELGGSIVRLEYRVQSPQGRWKVDEGISKTTEFIKMALVEAEMEESLSRCKDSQESTEDILKSVFGDRYESMC